MCTGEKSFIKGRVYKQVNTFDDQPIHKTTVIDEQGDEHTFGTWFKYFKLIK
jgi:hypothetical protein